VELRVKVRGRVGSGSVCARAARGGWWRALWRRMLRRPAGDGRPALPAGPP
jgi:hypothetical protein